MYLPITKQHLITMNITIYKSLKSVVTNIAIIIIAKKFVPKCAYFI